MATDILLPVFFESFECLNSNLSLSSIISIKLRRLLGVERIFRGVAVRSS